MSHIIQDFSQWKKINEDDLPGREKERGDSSNKVVAIPVDKNTLKLKVVNDADVIDGDGRLTIDGFDSILTWIKSQGEIINYYTTLNDLTNNIVVYSINKDNDRKQVIIFKIYSKNALKSQDPSSPGINSQVRFVRQDELSKALGGAILNTKSLQAIASQPSTGLKFPFSSALLVGSNDPAITNFIILAYNKIRKDPKAASSLVMPKVKAEAQAKKLGSGSQLFIKALNAGFAIADNEFPEDFETDITKELYDKISYIPEAESSVIKGFDIDAFLEVANSSQADTGDIKVPATGFTEGMQNNPELKKFQDLLARKFARHLANHATYQAFKKAGKKGYLGNYGPLTSALVKLLKIIAENPKYPNNNGSVIEPEFVNMVQKVNESVSNYIGLDGISLIVESEFNFANAEAVAPQQSTTQAVQRQREDNREEAVVATPKGVRYIEGKPYEYVVKDKQWKVRAKGSKGSWSLLTVPSSIKYLQKTYPSDGGTYLIPEKSEYRYKFEKIWKVLLGSSWVEANQDSKIKLTQLYGSAPGSASSEKEKQEVGMDTASMDKEFKNISNMIKTYIEGEGNFDAFKSGWGDSEEKAWNDGFIPYWDDYIAPKIKKLKTAISLIQNEPLKAKYQRNMEIFRKMRWDKTTDDGLYDTFSGGNDSDEFTWTIRLSDNTKTYTVDTDF